MLRITPSPADTPAACGAELMNVLAYLKPGANRLKLGAGRFEIGDVKTNFYLPPVKLEGEGMDDTVIATASCVGVNLGCAFELIDGATLAGMTLDNTTKGQSCAVGFGRIQPKADGTPVLGNQKAELVDVRTLAATFGIYNWAGGGNLLKVTRGETWFARWGVTQGVSSGPAAGTIELLGHRLYGRPDRGEAHGAYGDRVVGIVGRGGRIKAHAIVISVFGDPTIEVVRGAWTYWGKSATIDLFDPTISVVPAGAKFHTDCEEELGAINLFAGRGTGINGAVVKAPSGAPAATA